MSAFYSDTRPIERKDIRTYWDAPCNTKVVVINKVGLDKKRSDKCFATLTVKRGLVCLWGASAELMHIESGDRISFMNIDELFYVYKCSDGLKVFPTKVSQSSGLKTESRYLSKYVLPIFNAARLNINEPLKLKIKETNLHFNGNKLFEMVFPSRYRKALSKSSSNVFKKEMNK